jgi:hypothetical protein
MERLLKENTEAFYQALQKDFKTASSEYVFEVQEPLGTIEFTRSQSRSNQRSNRENPGDAAGVA